MYNPIRIAVAPLALILSLSKNNCASAFLSSSSSQPLKLNQDFDLELQKTIDNIRSYLSLEQRPKYFLRGAEQLCTEIDLGTDFFTEAALEEALMLDALVQTQPKELDFSVGVNLVKEIDARCMTLGGSSFSVTFAPDEECVEGDCDNMITIMNFPICLANCICADVAMAKMSDKVTIVRTNGDLHDVQKKNSETPTGPLHGSDDLFASDADADADSDSGLHNTSTFEDAPILRKASSASSAASVTVNLVSVVVATFLVTLGMISM